MVTGKQKVSMVVLAMFATMSLLLTSAHAADETVQEVHYDVAQLKIRKLDRKPSSQAGKKTPEQVTEKVTDFSISFDESE